MAENVINLRDYLTNTKILQQLFEANETCSTADVNNHQIVMAKPLPTDENNNNNNNNKSINYNINSVSHGLSQHHPMEYSFIILDNDVESILQNVPNEMFIQCFNFDKVMVRCLLMELHKLSHYHPANDMYEATICFDMSVLVTLSYLVNGHLEFIKQLGGAYFHDYSELTLKRNIQKMCQIFVYFLSPVYVRFPCSPAEQKNIKSAFLRQFGVPGVVGVLECYFVRLQNVPQHELHMYVNRRSIEPTLNVQVICDQNYRFLDINPRFSGNASNDHIWKSSHIKHIIQHSQDNEPNTWLIADRGYQLSSCVINPYRNARNIQRASVNTTLMEVHGVVDKAFALLKARFRCLNEPLPFSHKHAANVINSCVVLHNYLLAKNRPIEENVNVQLPKKGATLLNAIYEDAYATAGLLNRNFIKDFILSNSLQGLYKMHKNSYLSFHENNSSSNHLHNNVY